MFADSAGHYALAVGVIVCAALILSGLRWGFKFLRRAFIADMTGAVRDVTAVELAGLKQGQADLDTKLETLRTENADQHAQMRERIEHLEGRLPKEGE